MLTALVAMDGVLVRAQVVGFLLHAAILVLVARRHAHLRGQWTLKRVGLILIDSLEDNNLSARGERVLLALI